MRYLSYFLRLTIHHHLVRPFIRRYSNFSDSIIQMVLLVVSSSIIFYIGLIMVPAYLFVSTIELTLCIKYRIKISICQAIEYFVSYSYFAEIQPKHSVSKRSMAKSQHLDSTKAWAFLSILGKGFCFWQIVGLVIPMWFKDGKVITTIFITSDDNKVGIKSLYFIAALIRNT